ncbi:niacin transporter [Elusimicrobium posterum]|uniref:ECF transporter S component n=1 Tax=Elusimicrobium posterum TaxID=3116653 RepID=UPI003C71DA7F
MENILSLNSKNTVLNFAEKKAVLFQTLLLASALVLPSVCHYLGLPTNKFLPMHWPVLLAGLVYGWRSGLLLGLAAPLISSLISGMPAGYLLPTMAAEIAMYGFVGGLLKEKFNLNAFVSIIGALIVGKAAHALFLLGFAKFSTTFLTAGLAATAGQIAFLPLIANLWTKNSK